jgi:hypothetical protein
VGAERRHDSAGGVRRLRCRLGDVRGRDARDQGDHRRLRGVLGYRAVGYRPDRVAGDVVRRSTRRPVRQVRAARHAGAVRRCRAGRFSSRPERPWWHLSWCSAAAQVRSMSPSTTRRSGSRRAPDAEFSTGHMRSSRAGCSPGAWPCGPALALVGLAVAGGGISVGTPTLYGFAGHRVPAAERGRTVATVSAIADIGLLGGPGLVGQTADISTLRLAIATLAAIALALAASALVLRRWSGPHPPARRGERRRRCREVDP